jgi:hypothetical protein
VDRYNSLLRSAKQPLIAGNRAASADLLEQAERIIPVCPPIQDGGSPHAPLFTMDSCSAASAHT